jgi:hypothetical protein
MIFRAYEHYDPGTEKKITQSDFIIDADMMVTQVSESFSSAIIIHSNTPISEQSNVTLLTDISDLLKNPGFNEKAVSGDDLEELDKLDDQEPLGKDEKKELKQLENWKSNPNTAPSSTPSPSPVPTPTSEKIPPLPPPSAPEEPQAPPPPEASPTPSLPPVTGTLETPQTPQQAQPIPHQQLPSKEQPSSSTESPPPPPPVEAPIGGTGEELPLETEAPPPPP